MCLAIFKPAKCSITEEALRNGWQGNSDGAGFAFVRNGKVQIMKGFMTVKDFLEAYNTAVKANRKSPFVIHFRIRSRGEKNAENTHPFQIKDGVLIHNGSLDGTGAEFAKGKSDTFLFAEKFADRLPFDVVSASKKELGDAVGYNKVVILYDDGRHIIVNENLGHWKDDVWYSNHSYEHGSRSRFMSAREAATASVLLGG